MALQVGELFALFTADDTEFNKVLGQAESSFKAVGDEFMKIGKTMTATVTAPIVGTGVAALKMAGDFEASGLKVATIADQSVISFEDMQDGVLGLSNDVGISAEEINAALYEVLSATNDTANALAYTEIAAKTAKAGFTDTATSVDGLTTVLNAYGIKGGAAMQKVADQMMVAQNLGKTTFGEMASSIGNVIPIAASMQISTDSLFASLAALTSNGIKTSEAVTGIKAALSNVIKPTKEASEMSEALGLEFNAAHLKSVGWANFLDEVAKKTGGDTEKMAQLFGSVEALNTVTVLATTGAAGFDSALEAMGKSAGTTQSAFDTLNQGMNNGISRTMNLLKNLGIDIGTLLAPSIENVTLHIQDFVKWLSSLDDGTKQTIITTAGLVAAIGPLLLIVGTLFGSVSNIIGLYTTLSTSMAGLGVGFGSLILPIALVAAAIAGLVAAVIYLWNTDEDFRNAVIDAWGDIQQVIDGSVKAILQFLNGDLEGGLETLHESFIDVFGEGITNEVMRCVSVIDYTYSGCININTVTVPLFYHLCVPGDYPDTAFYGRSPYGIYYLSQAVHCKSFLNNK
jgi:TP901 family phage tail tape measure protein